MSRGRFGHQRKAGTSDDVECEKWESTVYSLQVFRCGCRLGHAIGEVWWALALPFRLVASIWRFGGAVGRFVISGVIELCVVVLGLLFFLMFSFGMIRTLLHPLFQ